MTYRGPNSDRIRNQQADSIFRYAGQTATWRQYVSAVSGNEMLGIGAVYYYREQNVSAVFGQYILPTQAETQGAGGTTIAGMFNVTTRQQLSNRDELIWNGVIYRMEGDSTYSKLGNVWLTPVKRGSGEV